jgi:hypothetical protein
MIFTDLHYQFRGLAGKLYTLPLTPYRWNPVKHLELHFIVLILMLNGLVLIISFFKGLLALSHLALMLRAQLQYNMIQKQVRKHTFTVLFIAVVRPSKYA